MAMMALSNMLRKKRGGKRKKGKGRAKGKKK
jgi:hypothetical protein